MPRKARPPKSSAPALRVMRFSGQMMSAGIEKHVIEDVTVRVYSVAKTVADCFRFRNRIGVSRVGSERAGNLHPRFFVRCRHFSSECGNIGVKEVMAATVEISVPDTLLKALGAQPQELPRRTLEALIVQAYRTGQITHAQVGELLDLDRWETDGFLKTSQAFRPLESEEFTSDLERLRRISKE